MEAADGSDFATAVEQRLRAGIKSLTIDLAELDSIGLGGVRALLRLARSLRDGGRSLDFLGGGHAVREALDQAGFHHFFPFTPPHISHGGHHDATP
jgi:anti-anti-sigma regulatory factor